MDNHIHVQQYDGDTKKYIRNPVEVEKMKESFLERVNINRPRIVSYNEALEKGIVNTKGRWNEEDMTNLEAYGFCFLENAYNLDYPEKDSPDWMAWIGEHTRNTVFHLVKIQWLCQIINNEGLYSVPQAVLKKSTWSVHPGQFRVQAIGYTECNEDFVLWDTRDLFPEKPILSFDEWWSLYSHHTDKALFCVDKKHILEMHVGEERKELYESVVETGKCFKGTKPILEGTCDERISHVFEHGTYKGHGVGIVGHLAFEDLKHMCDFHYKKPFIQKENFTLYNNYHK